MDEAVLDLISQLSTMSKPEAALVICKEFLKKIPTLRLHDREDSSSLSGTVDVLAPIDVRIVFNEHLNAPKKHTNSAEFYFGPNNLAEIKMPEKIIKGAWFEIAEIILSESNKLRRMEEYL